MTIFTYKTPKKSRKGHIPSSDSSLLGKGFTPSDSTPVLAAFGKSTGPHKGPTFKNMDAPSSHSQCQTFYLSIKALAGFFSRGGQIYRRSQDSLWVHYFSSKKLTTFC